MKKIALIATLIILTVSFISDNSFAITAKEIMDRSKSLKKPKTIKQQAVMLIIKKNRKEKIEFNGIFKDYGKSSRMRIEFKRGSRMEFLVWNRGKRGSVQWIKLSNGKIRKIPKGDKGASWLNSHFYNGDIGSNNIQNLKYKLIGSQEINGVKCYKIEGINKSRSRIYSKSIIYIGKEDYVVRKVDLFEKGKHTKTMTLERIIKISGIYTPRKITMARTDGKGKSIIYLRSIKYDVPIANYKLKRSGF